MAALSFAFNAVSSGHALALRNGSVEQGQFVNMISGVTLRWRDANGSTRDIPISQVSRIYLNPGSAFTAYNYTRGNNAAVQLDPLDLALLQRDLGPDTALVEYFVIDDELLAFVVTNTSVEVVREPAAPIEVARLAATLLVGKRVDQLVQHRE